MTACHTYLVKNTSLGKTTHYNVILMLTPAYTRGWILPDTFDLAARKL